jgi:hypothetical protein
MLKFFLLIRWIYQNPWSVLLWFYIFNIFSKIKSSKFYYTSWRLLRTICSVLLSTTISNLPPSWRKHFLQGTRGEECVVWIVRFKLSCKCIFGVKLVVETAATSRILVFTHETYTIVPLQELSKLGLTNCWTFCISSCYICKWSIEQKHRNGKIADNRESFLNLLPVEDL